MFLLYPDKVFVVKPVKTLSEYRKFCIRNFPEEIQRSLILYAIESLSCIEHRLETFKIVDRFESLKIDATFPKAKK